MSNHATGAVKMADTLKVKADLPELPEMDACFDQLEGPVVRVGFTADQMRAYAEASAQARITALQEQVAKMALQGISDFDQLRVLQEELAAVRADERERCAKVCEKQAERWRFAAASGQHYVAGECAAAIRSGGGA